MSSRKRVRTRRQRLLDAATDRLFRLPTGDHDYTVTQDVRVPMRDGVALLTDVYQPLDRSLGAVLIRTPYGRSTLISSLTARSYAAHGYVVVNQSCRGTFGSDGVFEPFVHELDDGADTVRWLRTQRWFGGRLALCGASYLGFAAWAVLMDPPPELACAVIAVSAHDNHWATHGSGAFSFEQMVSLFDAFDHLEIGLPRSLARLVTGRRRLESAYRQLPIADALDLVDPGSAMPYRQWLAARSPEDPVWRQLRLNDALERVTVPVLLQEGWQDRFVEQMLDQYERLRARGVTVALTIGPWTHVEVATKGLGVVTQDALDWLECHLCETTPDRRPSPVRIHVSGADEWRDLPAWPAETIERSFYLQPGGLLAESQPPAAAASTTFTFDPGDPTPAIGGQVVNPAIGGRRDNRKLEERADVLTFTSAPLAEPIEVIGVPTIELVHRTDNPWADLFVRVCEVTATGASTNLSDGFRRLTPVDAEGVVRITLDALAHRFVAGTRLRVQVSGGAHPRYARNLGTDENPATSTRLVVSRREICHGAGGCSRLLLPCAPAS